jgi:uncharacterized protein (DUF1800 family)
VRRVRLAPGPLPGCPVITIERRPLHVLNRLAFGPGPGDLATVERIGAERWIEQQLNRGVHPQPDGLTRQLAELETLRLTPVELFMQYGPPQGARRGQIKNDRAGGSEQGAAESATRGQNKRAARIVVQQAMRARLYRAVAAPNQLHEVMTTFWFNHFNVFAGKGLDYLWIGAYEEQAIRPHALGRFRDLLGATAKHPAMLFYLDNWRNTAPDSPGSRGRFEGINENYARELMELHTLGVNGGYSQQDVIALAHILTGWGIVRREKPAGSGFWRPRWRFGAGEVRTRDGFFFDPSRHDFTAKRLLGETIPGNGINEGERALDLLARHPATARHLSYQLAQYFVADNPPPALVERMATRYRASDGAIRDVLETLFASPEFWDQRYYAAKFKTPYEFVVSAARATGVPVRNPRPLINTMAGLGMPLYGCQTPDGYKNTQDAWLNPEAMMMRLSFATALGAGRLPLVRPVADFDDDDNAGGAIRPVGKPADDPAARPAPPDPAVLAMTLGDLFSSRTAAAVEAAPDKLRAPLILGSPEFMMR